MSAYDELESARGELFRLKKLYAEMKKKLEEKELENMELEIKLSEYLDPQNVEVLHEKISNLENHLRDLHKTILNLDNIPINQLFYIVHKQQQCTTGANDMKCHCIGCKLRREE